MEPLGPSWISVSPRQSDAWHIALERPLLACAQTPRERNRRSRHATSPVKRKRDEGLSILSLIPVIMILAATAFLMYVVMQYLQHYFWRSHRLTDLRLEAINQLAWLLAEFLTNYIADEDYTPSKEFLRSFRAAGAKARALFSDAAWQAFRRVEVMVGPSLGTPPGEEQGSVDHFIQLQGAALRAFYAETGLKLPGAISRNA